MKKTTRFKQLLHAPEILLFPVAHDPLSARIAEKVGFQAVGVGGYATSAALLGAPDVGLLTLTEMVDAAWRVADAVDVPVWCDGDTGHGGTPNVARTVRLFEKAGAASLMLEDQLSPKRCGHMTGKQVVPAAEMVSRIRAAVDARTDPDLMILARTDALALHGIEDAIERMHRYLEAGADWAFVEAPATVEEMRRITREIPGPHLANMLPGGRTPILPAAELQELGFAAAAFPTVVTYAYTRTTLEVLGEVLRSGTPLPVADRMAGFDEFNELVGLSGLRAAERRACDGPADR